MPSTIKAQRPARKPLREALTLDASSRIDRDAGVIKDVRILGAKSRNGREYTEAAMREAVTLYENADVHIDHRLSDKEPERGLWEAFGVLKNVHYVPEQKALRGDLHYLKTHEAAAKILERIERWPETIGLSHEAYGDARREGSTLIVDRITEVRSVDLVRDPATNATLFEEKRAMQMKLRKVLESCKALDQRAARLLEAEDVMDLPVMDSDYEMDSEEPSSSDVDAALAAMITSLLSDKSLDKASLMAKIEAIIDAVVDEPAPPAAEEPVAEMEGEDEEPMEESAKRVKANKAKMLEHKLAIRDAIDAAGLTVAGLGPKKLALLEAQAKIEHVETLLESWKAQPTKGAKPVVKPLRESESFETLRSQVLSEAKRRR